MTSKEAHKELVAAGLVMVRSTKAGVLYRRGPVVMIVANKSKLGPRTENDVRRACRQALALEGK